MRRVTFEVPGDPSAGRINGRATLRAVGRSSKRRIGKSDAYIAYMADVQAAALKARRRTGVSFQDGVLGISVSFYFPSVVDPNNKRRKIPLPGVPEGLGLTDVDAPVKCLLDGIQASGLIDDDVRFVEVHARKRVDKARPRAVVLIWTVANIDG